MGMWAQRLSKEIAMKDTRFSQVIGTLNQISIKGEDDCKRMLAVIQVLREMEVQYADQEQPGADNRG